MPSICLGLTFYKDNWPWRAVQTEGSAGGWLLLGELVYCVMDELFAKPRAPGPNAATSPARTAGRQLSSILPGRIRSWQHIWGGALHSLDLCWQSGLHLVILRLYFRLWTHRLRSIKLHINLRFVARYLQPTISIPLAAAIATNLPQRYHLPRNHNPSTQLQTGNYLSWLVLEDAHLLPWYGSRKKCRENISAL